MTIELGFGQVISVLIGAVMLGIGYWQGSRPLRTALKRLGMIFEDWYGVDDRPGVKGRPGVMLRLESIELTQNATAAELRTNGGSTVRDAVMRVEGTQADVLRELASLSAIVRSQAVVVVPENGNRPGDASSGGGGVIVAHPYRHATEGQ